MDVLHAVLRGSCAQAGAWGATTLEVSLEVVTLTFEVTWLRA